MYLKHNRKRFFVLLICLFVFGAEKSECQQADGSSNDKPASFIEKLNEKGLNSEIAYTGEFVSNVSGGLAQNSEYLSNTDLILSIDGEAFLNWKGATFNFYGLANYGGSPSEHIGDAQGMSNIDAPDAVRLYEAWYNQELFDERLSLLVGLFDLNSEFDVIESAGLFLNSSFGIGPDYSQSGQNGPSIFPVTSLALRARIQLSEQFSFQTAIFDAVPGDVSDPKSNKIDLSSEDGILVSSEIQYVNEGDEDSGEPYAKFAVGSWFYSEEFEHLTKLGSDSLPLSETGNQGFYALAEKVVYQDPVNSDQNLALFGRIGFANSDFNQFGSYFGCGIVTNGLFPALKEGQVGFAVAVVNNGDSFKKIQRDLGSPVTDSEISFELTVHSQLSDNIAIQPDIQYIINPGTDPSLDNAFVVGARFEIAL